MSFRPLTHPFTLVIAGPSGSGKTQWVARLRKEMDKMIALHTAIERSIWHNGLFQNVYSDLQRDLGGSNRIAFVNGVSFGDKQNIKEAFPRNSLLVYDDVMSEAGNGVHFAKLFTQGRHHQGVSVIFMLNNPFHQDKFMKTVQLNSIWFW